MPNSLPPPRPSPAAGELRERFAGTELFAGKNWRTSPRPWPLKVPQVSFLEHLGDAILAFYHATDLLYQRSAAGSTLLRNREKTAPWVAELYDKGKPAWLTEHARHPRVRGQIPAVLRPDLLPTEDGFALTELDSVPGGIGLTAFLNETYENRAEGGSVLGAEGLMIRNFFSAITHRFRQPDPAVVLAVSDEASTYRPETEWLAAKLREQGHRVWMADPNHLTVNDSGVFFTPPGETQPVRLDVVYRFFELFDYEAVSTFRLLMKAVEEGLVIVTPPFKPHLEEKLTLALFHHADLADFWAENLNRAQRETLAAVIPRSWVLQTETLPPGSFWAGPMLRGRPLRSWRDLGSASKRERELILKVSGFDPTSWGARGVTYGADVPGDTWRAAVDLALAESSSKTFVIQDFRKPALLTHPVFADGSETAQAQDGRLRLCPYYFPRGGQAHLSGGLATFCPSDKKIIHGMEDAALVPIASI